MDDCRDIDRLIPQRSPIRMIDRLIRADETSAVSSLCVADDNFFADEKGMLVEAGLVEHIAQTASAHAGHIALQEGKQRPPVGYIAEVRDFLCFRRPHVGEELETTVTVDDVIGDMTCISGRTTVGKETVAETKMRIYIKEND